MTYSDSTNPVHVTAEERRHPALQKLGRALVALARHQLTVEAESAKCDGTTSPANAEPAAPGQPEATTHE